MDFSYFVKSDKSLEKLGDCSQYANYKVILKAHLENKAETALIGDVSDYIIYTNAKFYNGIISRDLSDLTKYEKSILIVSVARLFT